MFGFTWYQNRQYQRQAEIQAQLDSVAMVEQMAAMALDSAKRAEGIVAEGEGVKVLNMPAYKDSLLTESRLATEGYYKLSNDKVEIEFTTRGAQPYAVKVNGYTMVETNIFYETYPLEGFTEYPLKLADDECFILADQRKGTEDSRFFGPVKYSELEGTVISVMRRNNL
jgi:hypothetical protein